MEELRATDPGLLHQHTVYQAGHSLSPQHPAEGARSWGFQGSQAPSAGLGPAGSVTHRSQVASPKELWEDNFEIHFLVKVVRSVLGTMTNAEVATMLGTLLWLLNKQRKIKV